MKRNEGKKEGKSNAYKGLRNLASCAVNALCRLPNTQAKSIVPVSVVTTEAPIITYNLTLEKHNAYYANGILVFNCLSFAYPVQASDHTWTLEKKSQQNQSDYNPLARDYVQKDIGYQPFKR